MCVCVCVCGFCNACTRNAWTRAPTSLFRSLPMAPVVWWGLVADPEFIPREDEETEDEDGLEVPMVGLDELIDTMTGMAIDEDGEGDEAEAALYGEGDVVPVGVGLSEDATPSDQEEF